MDYELSNKTFITGEMVRKINREEEDRGKGENGEKNEEGNGDKKVNRRGQVLVGK